MAELRSDKVDFKAKKITGDRNTLYNDKSVSRPGRHSNLKCVCIKQQSCKICEAKTDRNERIK